MPFSSDEILYNDYKVRCAKCIVCPTQLRFVMDIISLLTVGQILELPSLASIGHPLKYPGEIIEPTRA
jgi:hypothetical protein